MSGSVHLAATATAAAFELLATALHAADDHDLDDFAATLRGPLDDCVGAAVSATRGEAPQRIVEPRITPIFGEAPAVAAARRVVENGYDGDDAILTVVRGGERRRVPPGRSSADVGLDDCDAIVAVRRTGEGPKDFRLYKARLGRHTRARVARVGTDRWTTCVDGRDLPDDVLARVLAAYWHG